MGLSRNSRVMICQPMAFCDEEEILEVRTRATAKLEGMGYMVIDTYFQDDWYSKEAMEQRGVVNNPLCFFAKSIEKMSMCDFVYFAKGWEKTRGCRLEHEVALAYELKVIYED